MSALRFHRTWMEHNEPPARRVTRYNPVGKGGHSLDFKGGEAKEREI